MRTAVLLVLLAATALAQSYGVAPESVTLANASTITPASVGVPSFLTAEDRRFAVALNWARQDPPTFKQFMAAEGYNMPDPFLAQLQPNFALHWDAALSAAAHFHTLEEIQKSPATAIAYNQDVHCPNPSKWPGQACSPPLPFVTSANLTVEVECFRREGCYNPSEDYYERMAAFDRPVAPFPKATASGGEFIAAGQTYVGDIYRQIHATQSLVCDSDDVVSQPKNCTKDNFNGKYGTSKEILYASKLGLKIQGTGYNSGPSKQGTYFDTYFAAGPATETANPIATATYLRVSSSAAYFVLNYREPNNAQGFPSQAGVIYQLSGQSNSSMLNLNHATTAGQVYTLLSILHLQCNTTDPINQIEYAFFVVDSKNSVYRYPENANLNICAGFDANSLDIVPDSSAAVTNGAIVFNDNSNPPPTTARPELKPTVSIGGGGNGGSSSGNAAALLPAVLLILAAFLAMFM